jgi:uncharacterized protein (DUF427 family)
MSARLYVLPYFRTNNMTNNTKGIQAIESVWDYPRPPRAERTDKHVKVIAGGELIAESTHTVRILETSHPPVYYIPPEDVELELLTDGARKTLCEWKGFARYYTISVAGQRIENSAWYYRNPWPPYTMLQDYIAFYPQLMDACYVDGELVTPDPSSYYGGWITHDILGPFRKRQ